MGVRLPQRRGSIPAGAGSTLVSFTLTGMKRVHPRGGGEHSCTNVAGARPVGPSPRGGEHPTGPLPPSRPRGPSPRGRGALFLTCSSTRHQHAPKQLSLKQTNHPPPSPAGTKQRPKRPRPQHPRADRKQKKGGPAALPPREPPPRARGAAIREPGVVARMGSIPAGAGSRVPGAVEVEGPGFIPAGTGSRRSASRSRSDRRDHPHAHGEQRLHPGTQAREVGVHVGLEVLDGYIPARRGAGAGWRVRGSDRGFILARAGAGRELLRLLVPAGPSPRARGARRGRVRRHSLIGVHPHRRG